jgi:hypothetical protein
MESAQREREEGNTTAGEPNPPPLPPCRATGARGSSSSPPRPAGRRHEPRQSSQPKLLLAPMAGQELGGHQHHTTGRERRRLFQETRRPTLPRPTPARGAWTEEKNNPRSQIRRRSEIHARAPRPNLRKQET